MVDSLQSQADVKEWLSHYSVIADNNGLEVDSNELLSKIRELRETIRQLIDSRKDGQRLDLELLNSHLEHGVSHLQLAKMDKGQYALNRVRKMRTIEQLLAPVAEAAAELLALNDFSRVRKCESPDCVLWFYDRTKGHKRRWCSMAICGNRHKVSSFRKRQSV
jgi:predicted RNA-binding Zn ribbon-like protein